MPGNQHVAGANAKENRMYEHIKQGMKGNARAKEIAARTVNKYRAKHGLTKKSSFDVFFDGPPDPTDEVLALMVEHPEEIGAMMAEVVKEFGNEVSKGDSMKKDRMGGPYEPAGRKPDATSPDPYEAQGHAVDHNKGSNQKAGGFATKVRPGGPPEGSGKDEPKQSSKLIAGAGKSGKASKAVGTDGTQTGGKNVGRGPGPDVGSSRASSGMGEVNRNPHQGQNLVEKGLDWIHAGKSKSLLETVVSKADDEIAARIEKGESDIPTFDRFPTRNLKMEQETKQLRREFGSAE
jgi:hypothetical protein